MVLGGEQRFWEKVDQSAGPDGCWIWTGPVNKGGYGIGPSAVRADKLAMFSNRGSVPVKGLVMGTAQCNNRLCCNPSHLNALLEPVYRPRTHPTQRKNAELTDTLVQEIKTLYAAGVVSRLRLSREYSVPIKTISEIAEPLDPNKKRYCLPFEYVRKLVLENRLTSEQIERIEDVLYTWDWAALHTAKTTPDARIRLLKPGLLHRTSRFKHEPRSRVDRCLDDLFRIGALFDENIYQDSSKTGRRADVVFINQHWLSTNHKTADGLAYIVKILTGNCVPSNISNIEVGPLVEALGFEILNFYHKRLSPALYQSLAKFYSEFELDEFTIATAIDKSGMTKNQVGGSLQRLTKMRAVQLVDKESAPAGRPRNVYRIRRPPHFKVFDIAN